MRATFMAVVCAVTLAGCGGTAPAAPDAPATGPARETPPAGEAPPAEDPYVDEGGVTRTAKVSAVLLGQGYREEEGSNGPEQRAWCEVRLTNNSELTITASVDVIFTSPDGAEQLATSAAGGNDLRPGQSRTEKAGTLVVLKPTPFACQLGTPEGYVPRD